MSVINFQAVQRPGRDLENWRVRTKPRDPLADDHAVAHRIQWRPAWSGVVDALVDRAVDDVCPRQWERHSIDEDVGRGLRARSAGSNDSDRVTGRRRGGIARGWHRGARDWCTTSRRPAPRQTSSSGIICVRGHFHGAGGRGGRYAAVARLTAARTASGNDPGRSHRGPIRSYKVSRSIHSAGGARDPRARDSPTRGRSRSFSDRPRRRGRSFTRSLEDKHRSLEHRRPGPDVDRPRWVEGVTTLEVDHRIARQRTEDPIHHQMRHRKNLVKPSLRGRDKSTLAAQAEHDPRAARQHPPVDTRLRASSRPGSGARFGRRDRARKHRARRNDGSHRHRHPLTSAAGTTAQPRHPPTLAGSGERTLPQLHRAQITDEHGAFANRVNAHGGQPVLLSVVPSGSPEGSRSPHAALRQRFAQWDEPQRVPPVLATIGRNSASARLRAS